MSLDETIQLAKLEQELEKSKLELENTYTNIFKQQGMEERIYEPNKPRISLLNRIFRTNKYKNLMEKYQKELEEYKEKLHQRKMVSENQRDLIESIQNKEHELEVEIKRRNSKTISTEESIKEKIRMDIRFNPLGIPVIDSQNEEILNYMLNRDLSKNFSMNDIMMVHATKYFPDNFVLKTSKDSKVAANDSKTITERNTLHFALNGKVSSHGYGNWDDVPYVFLDPIKTHIDQIACLKDNDTFTYGSLKLSTDAIILINKNVFDEVYQEHMEEINTRKNNIIIFYGDSKIVVDKILILLGYKPQSCGMWSWTNEQNSIFLYNYVRENYPDKLTANHFYTKYALSEKQFAKRDTLLNRMRNSIEDYSRGCVITIDELYNLYVNYCKNSVLEDELDNIKDFTKNYGINCHDNEIHLLGYKEYIENL